MPDNKYQRFANLSFEDFRRMAQDESLSANERIGFPDEYRQGKAPLIAQDVLSKLTVLNGTSRVFLDIGPGCGELPSLLVEHCRTHAHRMLLVDSDEMLRHLPDAPFIEKYPGFYPKCDALFSRYGGQVDAILCYSVFHYVFAEANVWEFLDSSLTLLSEGGQMLIGDIPNISKRKRFFSSAAGVRFHQAFTGKDERPQVEFNTLERGQIDDSVIFAVVQRVRAQGFDAYILPQEPELPMANRREDILIVRP